MLRLGTSKKMAHERNHHVLLFLVDQLASLHPVSWPRMHWVGVAGASLGALGTISVIFCTPPEMQAVKNVSESRHVMIGEQSGEVE